MKNSQFTIIYAHLAHYSCSKRRWRHAVGPAREILFAQVRYAFRLKSFEQYFLSFGRPAGPDLLVHVIDAEPWPQHHLLDAAIIARVYQHRVDVPGKNVAFGIAAQREPILA